MGGKTEKMKYGHRGINHAVLIGNRVYITSHNHGYAVNGDSLKGMLLLFSLMNALNGSKEL